VKDWGTYRKLFERLEPDFERLPYQARCLAAEILRRCDRIGQIVPGNELNTKLVQDLAFHVRAHTGEEDFLFSTLGTLLTDGYLVFRNGYLVVRNFVEAQRSDSAARMAEKRARDAAQAMDDTGEEPLDVTSVTGASDERDASDAQHELLYAGASSRLVSSRLVSESDPGSGSDPEATTGKSRSAGARPAKRALAAENKPFQMHDGWQPPADYVAILAAKFEVSEARISAEVPEFRWYWVSGLGKGKKSGERGWIQTFGNNIKRLADRGSLYFEPAKRANGGAPVRGPQPVQPSRGEKVWGDP
jgi:hypothetical protein